MNARPTSDRRGLAMLFTTLCLACVGPPASSTGAAAADTANTDGSTGASAPTVGTPSVLIPSAALPAEVTALTANNNLDVVRHAGRVFLAYRTAKWHFADSEVWLYVISSADEKSWRFEGKFHMGTDLREPRFLSWQGKLWLFFAVLGKELGKFEPGDARVSKYDSPGKWSVAKSMGMGDFIPWRARVLNGKPYLIGYNNGGDVYAGGKFPDIHVKVLTTSDGAIWLPAFGGDGVVLKGGISETDFAFTSDGTLVAVGRNEAGDHDGFGSKICTAKPGKWAEWTCAIDPKKYDSPLVFAHKGEIWLIGRRTTKNDGHFDLGHEGKPHDKRYTDYQVAWWTAPKRCALWKVDPDTRTVVHVLDLPSRGDTCFASVVGVGQGTGPNGGMNNSAGVFSVYNYTSPLDGADVKWQTGQFGPTQIYRATLSL